MSDQEQREPMTQGQYERVLDAISSLDDKLTAALNTGLAALNTAILALTEAHHRALLEQERRNSTFATTLQLEAVIRRQDKMAEEAGGREARIKNLEQFHDQETANSFLRSSSILGYVITAMITGGAVTLAFLLSHAATVGHP